MFTNTVDAIEAVVFIRGLRPHITRLEGGDRTKIAETLVAAQDAVLAHRSCRLRAPPASATATIDRAYHPLLDLATPGKWPQPRPSRRTAALARRVPDRRADRGLLAGAVYAAGYFVLTHCALKTCSSIWSSKWSTALVPLQRWRFPSPRRVRTIAEGGRGGRAPSGPAVADLLLNRRFSRGISLGW